MFTDLLGFLAQFSSALWAVVLVTLAVRFIGIRLYRRDVAGSAVTGPLRVISAARAATPAIAERGAGAEGLIHRRFAVREDADFALTRRLLADGALPSAQVADFVPTRAAVRVRAEDITHSDERSGARTGEAPAPAHRTRAAAAERAVPGEISS
jgi:hypothetical protein